MSPENPSKAANIEGSGKSQEMLAEEYLNLYKEYRALMKPWEELDAAKYRYRDENMHMPDFEEKYAEYEQKQGAISKQRELLMNEMQRIGSKLTQETKDKYLKVQMHQEETA